MNLSSGDSASQGTCPGLQPHKTLRLSAAGQNLFQDSLELRTNSDRELSVLRHSRQLLVLTGRDWRCCEAENLGNTISLPSPKALCEPHGNFCDVSRAAGDIIAAKCNMSHL